MKAQVLESKKQNGLRVFIRSLAPDNVPDTAAVGSVQHDVTRGTPLSAPLGQARLHQNAGHALSRESTAATLFLVPLVKLVISPRSNHLIRILSKRGTRKVGNEEKLISRGHALRFW